MIDRDNPLVGPDGSPLSELGAKFAEIASRLPKRREDMPLQTVDGETAAIPALVSSSRDRRKNIDPPEPPSTAYVSTRGNTMVLGTPIDPSSS